MHIASIRSDSPLDWRRISAFGVSFLLHATAALLVAMPLAAGIERVVVPTVVEARLLETPPPAAALPLPPEPEVPPKPRPVPRVLPVPVVVSQPVVVDQAPPQQATDAATDLPTAPLAGDAADAGSAGETRMLAYDGTLKLRYPASAIRRGASGTVLLHVLVGVDGKAQRIELSRSSGHHDLDKAARDAVQRARFRPVLENGVPVPGWGLVPIAFQLDRA